MNFVDIGLSDPLLRALNESGYTEPTPIQEKAIPQILMGKDILGIAQTGTGKTGAFAMPILDILSHGKSKPLMPRAIILEPTRELAQQVEQNFVKYGKYMDVKTALVVGGTFDRAAGNQFARGIDVIIATPGRLLDIIERGQIILNSVQLLILDECDRMLDMGFIPDIEKLTKLLPGNRQNLLFSATMSKEIRKIAETILVNPREISVSASSSTAVTVTQSLVVVDEINKRKALRYLLNQEGVQNAFIFCNRKRDVDTLFKSLQKHGFSAGALHGDMEQDERYATMAKFKAGELSLLVCSDVAARGIDISGLSHVFNFDVPFNAEDYVHRIGRTGRAGKTGIAYMIATPFDGLSVKAIEELSNQSLMRFPMPDMENLELITSKAEMKSRPRAPRPDDKGRDKSRSARKPRPDTKLPPEQNAHIILENNTTSANPSRPMRTRPPAAQSTSAAIPADTARPIRSRQPAEKQDKPSSNNKEEPNPVGFGSDIPNFLR